ncbi:hypothetical protein [Rhizobium paknamense]|uniref:Phage tail assembly chaperone n=1 Tax=Rhizobium paknamense TaxID=1206817 RepID=A0ABU0IA93_9HYPH|nr:hypothetical protein [Rhizobium paknamense]MDQ0455149.1 hypothetical protein [Rhizobium paknamense]
MTLRPTLRAAVTLEARFGFPAMFRALEEGSFTVISEIIRMASSPMQDAAAFLFGIAGKPLSSFIIPARIPLAELVSMLMPTPDPKAKRVPNSGKPVTWPDFYAGLYENATGWLGWAPEQAWNATPNEICRAYAGHVTKLKAIHGSGEEQGRDHEQNSEQAARSIADGLDPEFDRNALRALKAKLKGAR